MEYATIARSLTQCWRTTLHLQGVIPAESAVFVATLNFKGWALYVMRTMRSVPSYSGIDMKMAFDYDDIQHMRATLHHFREGGRD